MKAALLLVLAGCFSKPDSPGVCGTQPTAVGLELELDADPVVRFLAGADGGSVTSA